MAQRVTLRKRQPYNTSSARRRVVKTPGGKLVVHHIRKLTAARKCGDCGLALAGLPIVRPRTLARVGLRHKHVSRAYGGSVCAPCVKQRITRAFLIEEATIVKRVLKAKAASAKK